MEKQNNSQFELFLGTGVSARLSGYKADKTFLAYIRYYEKTLLVIIGIVITGIISFSLGVERGKGLSMSSSIPIGQVQQIKAREETVKEPETPEKDDYIIQLASYKTKTYAKREAELLKKNGLSPLILNKGNYTVLYVGNFPSRKTAQSLLSELKKRYKDCYIRRL